MRFKADATGGELNGFVDRGSHLKGELRFENSFRVEGKVEGTVSSHGHLIVGEGGEVSGEIRAGEVFIAGTVHGTIHAEKKVQIAPGGRVTADLFTPGLVIENGAIFEGKCTMKSALPTSPDAAKGADKKS
jgi:cytoskeletal protein CcmA (bactofilin family)